MPKSNNTPAVNYGFTKTFTNEETFQAARDACEWLRENGYSVGAIQGPAPRGIMLGDDWDIAKWRNLSKQDVDELDGVLTGDMRDGPVTVRLKVFTPAEANIGQNI